MIGWLIILGISIVLLVVGIILTNIYDWCCEEIGASIAIISVIIIFVSISVIPGCYLSVKQEVLTFENYQEMVDITYSGDETVDTAMNLKIIEMNQWLAKAKASEEIYGNFSFYKGKLDELEYIEIDIE